MLLQEIFLVIKGRKLLFSHGRNLEILCIYKPVGDKAESLQSLLIVNFNANILSLEKVQGLKKDYAAIVSDSGKLVILEFDFEGQCFKPVREHIIEKNKLEVTSRFTPGYFLAVDPKSQAIAVGAIEENLLFYALCNGPDESENPKINEISKPRFIYFDLVPVFNDAGIPFFACLEAQAEEFKSPYPPDVRQSPDSKKETDYVLDYPETHSPKPASRSTNGFNTSVLSVKRRLESSSSSDDDFESISQGKMQPRNGGKNKNNLKMPSLWSHFKKPHPFIDSVTSRENNVQSSNLLKISNMPNFSVNTVSSVKDNLQTAKFLSDINEPENLMKFAIRFVEDYMQTKNKSSEKQNFSIDVAPSVEDNLQSLSLSNKPHPSLKYGVQPPTATKSHLNEKKLTPKKILKPIIHTNSSDEICSDDEAYSIFNPMSSEKDRNKLPPMVLRIYKWHWQSKKMFQCAFPLSKHANKLISVPPGDCHKGGILVCFCNRVDFLEIDTGKRIRSFFPQRKNLAFENKKGMLISRSAVYKKDDKLLIFLQSEEGDLYSVKIVRDNELNMKWTYIDTVPVASAMCIIEEKFLFLAADYGDHFLYKINSLGSMENEKSHKIHKITDSDKLDLYIARQLTNLELLSGIENLTPVINCIAEAHVCIKNCFEDVSDEPDSTMKQFPDHVCNELLQFHFTCGQGSCSTLRTMRYGVEVIEWKSEELPEIYPDHMWTYKKEINGDIVTFIIISFSFHNETLVLSIAKEISIEPNDQFQGIDPKFDNDRLLDCVQIKSDFSIQVFSRGVRYSFEGDKIEWMLPPCDCQAKVTGATEAAEPQQCEQHTVHQCAIHKNQVALVLKTKELVYLEVLESEEERFKFDEKKSEYIPDYAAYCMEFLPSDDRADFLIVCFEKTIQIFSVGDEGISKDSMVKQDLYYPPSSLVVHSAVNRDQLISYITIGFEGGYVQRFIFTHENRELKNSFLLMLEDSRTVTLIKTKIDNEEAIIALSRFCTWISFNCKTQFEFLPLLSEKIECAVGFNSESYPMANLIAVLGHRLVFLEVKKSPSLVLENRQQLELTPRQSAFVDDESLIVIALSDYGKPYHKNGDVTPQHAMDITLDRTSYKAPNPTSRSLSEIVKNEPFSKYDCELRVYDPVSKQFICESLKLPRDHSIVRMCVVEFDSSEEDEWYIAAIVKKGSYKYETIKRKPLPIIKSELYFDSYIILYEVRTLEDEKTNYLEEVCEMKTDFIAEAICPFAGRVLVGIKDTLCLCNYETGLFVEANLKMPCKISNIYAHGDMFVVLCDNRNIIYGYFIETHDELEILELRLLCEDQHLHKVTAVCFWDQDIMVAADVYGYLNVVLTPAIPNDVRKKDYKLPTKFKENKLEENKEPNIEEYRFTQHSYVIARQYIGEVITSLQTTSFLEKSRDLFLYSTLSGSVGVLVPFFTEEPDTIFKPLQFLIKSKSQFHNRDSTDYPSSYINRNKFNEKQYPMLDQCTPMSEGDDTLDCTGSPGSLAHENASPAAEFSIKSKDECDSKDSIDKPENTTAESFIKSKDECESKESVDEPENTASLNPLYEDEIAMTAESSFKSKDECESKESVDEPENTASLNPLYEDEIAMSDESSNESTGICDKMTSTGEHETYSSICKSFEEKPLMHDQTTSTSELLTASTSKFGNVDSSAESENSDETCKSFSSMSDTELPFTPKCQLSNKDSTGRCINFQNIKKSSKKKSLMPGQFRTKLQKMFHGREPPLFVIDGNLCDLFHTLSEEDQQDIADYLQTKPYEISEKLAELKASIHCGVNEDWLEDDS